jgi:hypothetical protein
MYDTLVYKIAQRKTFRWPMVKVEISIFDETQPGTPDSAEKKHPSD